MWKSWFVDHHCRWEQANGWDVQALTRPNVRVQLSNCLPDRFLLAERDYVIGRHIGEKSDNVARALTWHCVRRLRENHVMLEEPRPLRRGSCTTNTIYWHRSLLKNTCEIDFFYNTCEGFFFFNFPERDWVSHVNYKINRTRDKAKWNFYKFHHLRESFRCHWHRLIVLRAKSLNNAE